MSNGKREETFNRIIATLTNLKDVLTDEALIEYEKMLCESKIRE